MSFEKIPLDRIQVGPEVARRRRPDTGLDKLTKSIRRWGLLYPIIVFPKEDKYELVVGQRRLLACKQLGWKKIPAKVISPVDTTEAKILSLIENIQKEELTHKDMIDVVQYLYKKFGSLKAVAEELGISFATVSAYIPLSLAPKWLRQMVEDRKISMGDAKRVVDCTMLPDGTIDEEKARKIAKEIAKMTVPKKRRLLDIARERPEASPEKIIEEAKKPSKETVMTVHLSTEFAKALKKAAEARAMSEEDLMRATLADWLTKSK